LRRGAKPSKPPGFRSRRCRRSGQSSGVPVEGDAWFLFAVPEGKIQRLTIHATEAEALKAAGLQE
jgi:hypothetical protein